MKKEVDLSAVESGIEQSIKEYSNIPLPDDLTKIQALQIVSKEVKMISDEQTRRSNEHIQEERLQLDKDRVYESQKLEKDKFKEEQKKNENDYNLAQERINLDKRRLDLDEKIFLANEEGKKREKVFNLIGDIAKVAIPAMLTLIGTAIYVKFMKQCMAITMIDNGLVPKSTTDVINRFDKVAKF